jgi:hypothetical protein
MFSNNFECIEIPKKRRKLACGIRTGIRYFKNRSFWFLGFDLIGMNPKYVLMRDEYDEQQLESTAEFVARFDPLTFVTHIANLFYLSK